MSGIVEVTNAEIEALEKVMMEVALEHPEIEAETKLEHFYCGGVYARQLFMREGTVAVGKTHKHDHVCTISHGTLLIKSRSGKVVIEAPYTFNTKAGEKRAVIAITDVVFTTYHSLDLDISEFDSKTLDKIESILVEQPRLE